MNPEEMHELDTQRLARLERDLRALRAAKSTGTARSARVLAAGVGAGLAAGISLAVLFGATQAAPARVSATGFDVIGKDGKVRARLDLAANDEPRLELLDVNGVAQATLALGTFRRPDDERLKLKRSEARKLRPAEEPLHAVLRLGSGMTERDPRLNDNSIIEPAIEIGAGDRLRALRMRGQDGDERVELRVGPYAPDEIIDLEPMVETTFRMKTFEEEVLLEFGVEPVSAKRPADRRPPIGGRAYEVPAPYFVLFGELERPIFFLSNWTAKDGLGDEPTMDMWDSSQKLLFAVPDVEREKHEHRQDAAIRQLQSEG